MSGEKAVTAMAIVELVVTVVEVMAARELAEAEVKAELVEVVTEGAAEAMMEVMVKQ